MCSEFCDLYAHALSLFLLCWKFQIIIFKAVGEVADTRTLLCHEYEVIQSTLVISKSKGLSEILRDIRTSTYQICRIEEKKLIRLTTFNKYMFKWTL